MDTSAASELLAEYEAAAARLDAASSRLSRHVAAAGTLIGAGPGTHAATDIADLTNGLRRDGADLAWRRDLLARIDALASTPGAVVDAVLPASGGPPLPPGAIIAALRDAHRLSTPEIAAALVAAARRAGTDPFFAGSLVAVLGVAGMGGIARELVGRISGGEPGEVAVGVTGLVAVATVLGTAERAGGATAAELRAGLLPPADGGPWSDDAAWLLALTVGAGGPSALLVARAGEAVVNAPRMPGLMTGPFSLHHTTQEIDPAVAALQKPGQMIMSAVAASSALVWTTLVGAAPLPEPDVVGDDARRAAAEHVIGNWDDLFPANVADTVVIDALAEVVRDPVSLDAIVQSRLVDVYDRITDDVASANPTLAGAALERDLARDLGRIAGALDALPAPTPPLGAIVANGLADIAQVVVPYVGAAPGSRHYGLAIDALRIPELSTPPPRGETLHDQLVDTLAPDTPMAGSNVIPATDVQVAIANAVLEGNPRLAASLEPGPWVFEGRFTPPPPDAPFDDHAAFSETFYDAITGFTADDDLGHLHAEYVDRITEAVDSALGGH